MNESGEVVKSTITKLKELVKGLRNLVSLVGGSTERNRNLGGNQDNVKL